MFLQLLATSVLASERDLSLPLGGAGNVVSVDAPDNFCLFLPPQPGLTVAQSEGYPRASAAEQKMWAVSFCTQNNAKAIGSRLIPDGVITGAHYKKNSDSVQITGTWNAKIMGIPLDGGGYYDLDNNVNSPPGGMCAGYDSFYNSIDPVDGTYCIKCCTGITTCGIQNGEKGCAVMVPGDYSSTFDVPLPKTGVVAGGNSTSVVVPTSPPVKSSAITNAISAIASLILML
jgi:hypothetical protein